MMSRRQADAHAARMTRLHGRPWLVFRTPDGARCNQAPGNAYNTGRYAACDARERADYEAGGAVFDDRATGAALLSVLA